MKSNQLVYQGILGAALVVALSGCAIVADSGSALRGRVANPISYDAEADTAGVEFVMSSNDTFAGVIDNAVKAQGVSAVVGALEDSAQLAASGGDPGWPTFEAENAVPLDELFGTAAAALAAGADLPPGSEVGFVEVDGDDNPETSRSGVTTASVIFPAAGVTSSTANDDSTDFPEISLAEAINNGSSWRDTYWIQVLVTTGGGGATVTDRVDATITVDPGAKTSKIGYKTFYFPSTNKFSAINIQTEAFENDINRGWAGHQFGKLSGNAVVYNTTDIQMNGRLLTHKSELSAFVGGRLYNDIRGTGVAVCETATNVCKY